MARALSQAQIDAIAANGRALLQKERAKASPKVVNIDNALALGAPIPLVWDGEEYRVGPIAYHDGLRLQKASLRFKAWGENPPQSEEALDEQGAYVADLLDFMHGLLHPKPSENPFASASPWEVGQLAAFFLMCQTKQRDRSRLGTDPRRFTM